MRVEMLSSVVCPYPRNEMPVKGGSAACLPLTVLSCRGYAGGNEESLRNGMRGL